MPFAQRLPAILRHRGEAKHENRGDFDGKDDTGVAIQPACSG